jgi:NTP pyrophosphatase (non-canonical NTP hydrolase)
MNEALNEVLSLLTQECAEVIHAIAKANHFGLETVHKGKSNIENIQQEIADVLTLIVALTCRHPEFLNEQILEFGIRHKVERLNKYTKYLQDFSVGEILPAEDEDSGC